MNRRALLRTSLAVAGAAALPGCGALSESPSVRDLLESAESLTQATQRLVLSRSALAPVFPREMISPAFRANGSNNVDTDEYRVLQAGGFADYRLEIAGMVERPLSLSLADLRARPNRTQITKHDCVEGWTCIGEWTGTPLGALLEEAGLHPGVRFVVFHCFDSLEPETGELYYESIDLIDAFHPQTILAYDMNGAPLPVPYGAPLRLRVERQLGYKHAKFIRQIEAVDSFAGIGGGKGGYWEDRNYEWYAGI